MKISVETWEMLESFFWIWVGAVGMSILFFLAVSLMARGYL